jgi:hypothetical protein
MQKRVKALNVTIEANYFPITTMAYIEDEKSRISLVVDHAQAAASWQQVNKGVYLGARGNLKKLVLSFLR